MLEYSYYNEIHITYYNIHPSSYVNIANKQLKLYNSKTIPDMTVDKRALNPKPTVNWKPFTFVWVGLHSLSSVISGSLCKFYSLNC